ncbi:MAG: hypothetical protein ACYC1C_22005, partial [Chloroflexota bacterium]
VGLASLLAAQGWVRWPIWGISAGLLCFSGIVLFAHLSYVNGVAGYGATMTEEVRYYLGALVDNPRLTWIVVKDHYGPWAWLKPGP